MTTTEQYTLRWNNFYSNVQKCFHELFEAAEMVDVTLAVEGRLLRAHKIVLSICSPYFRQIFKTNPCQHPIVILKDVYHEDIKDILNFMYMGEVNVLKENLSSFLRTAELLQVKGLTGDDSSETSSKKDEKLDNLCENEENELIQYSQLIDSDMEEPTHYTASNILDHSSDVRYSASQSITPPPTHVSQQQTPPAQSPSKRQSKSTGSSNSKRSKSDSNHKSSTQRSPVAQENTNGSLKSSVNARVDDNEFVDASNLKINMVKSDSPNEIEEPNETVMSVETRDNKDFNASVIAQDTNGGDQDQLLYSSDEKGHVYCPHCLRKFVNRYNLKVHIRDKHQTAEVDLDCEVCGKTMRNMSCLRVHLYHHRKQQSEAMLSNLQDV